MLWLWRCFLAAGVFQERGQLLEIFFYQRTILGLPDQIPQLLEEDPEDGEWGEKRWHLIKYTLIAVAQDGVASAETTSPSLSVLIP